MSSIGSLRENSEKFRVYIVYVIVVCLCGAAYLYNEYVDRNIQLYMHKNAQGVYDYATPHPSYYFIVVCVLLLCMAEVVRRSLMRKNGLIASKLRLLGIVLYIIAAISMLDYLVEPWGIPGRCGGGLVSGNCFLADGLNTIVYWRIIPVCILLGTIFILQTPRLWYAINRH